MEARWRGPLVLSVKPVLTEEPKQELIGGKLQRSKSGPLEALLPPLRSPADRNSRRGGPHQK